MTDGAGYVWVSMTNSTGVLAPIPGAGIDPPPKSKAKTLKVIDDKSRSAGVGFRALNRFNGARSTLLAAGTTYYVFLSIFALVALAYGVVALVGADRIAESLTETLDDAFPGLVGSEGIDAQQLKNVGQASSIVGLLGMLYASSGAMGSVSESIHQIYGAPKDPRNFAIAKLRLIGWVLIIAPMILLSFAQAGLVGFFAGPIVNAIGLEGGTAKAILTSTSLLIVLILDFLIIYLLLSFMGGIRPSRRARVIGSAVGVVGIEILKLAMGAIIAFTVAKPQYGSFAAPIAIMFVLYLQTMTLYASAAITAGVALESHSHDSPDAPVDAGGPQA
jgi:membrane protein